MARALPGFYGYLDPRHHDRIREHSAKFVNDRIDQRTAAQIADIVSQGRSAILARVDDLDREWDVDRALMATFATVGTLTFALGMRRDRRWLWVFGAQQVFLLLHSLIGWCPPVPILRRLGFRTSKEISAERQQLTRRLKG